MKPGTPAGKGTKAAWSLHAAQGLTVLQVLHLEVFGVIDALVALFADAVALGKAKVRVQGLVFRHGYIGIKDDAFAASGPGSIHGISNEHAPVAAPLASGRYGDIVEQEGAGSRRKEYDKALDFPAYLGTAAWPSLIWAP